MRELLYPKTCKPFSKNKSSYAPVVEGVWFEDYPTNLMADGKFIAIPTLIGHTTHELSDRIATIFNYSSSETILQFTAPGLPFTNPAVLWDMLELFPEQDYLDLGPPGSGSQWSRVVDVDNYLQSFCAVYNAAGQIAAKGKDVFKCKLIAPHS